MTERPILFSGPMVRAILEGRKTMTRRVAIPRFHDKTPCEHWEGGPTDDGPVMCRHCEHGSEGLGCPHGEPGDRLWVKETFGVHRDFDRHKSSEVGKGLACYRADESGCPMGLIVRWRPSIFMPRKLSRLTLEITAVRVERVQDITPEDAMKEGSFLGRCPCPQMQAKPQTPIQAMFTQTGCHIHGEEFKCLWDSINAKRGFGWSVNPFVWVISFKRV